MEGLSAYIGDKGTAGRSPHVTVGRGLGVRLPGDSSNGEGCKSGIGGWA